jgi:sec-independent protein translocase protein TatA
MGIGLQELLIILMIVLLVFGTKRLRNVGSDLGGAIKSFRSAMKEPESNEGEPPPVTGKQAEKNENRSV